MPALQFKVETHSSLYIFFFSILKMPPSRKLLKLLHRVADSQLIICNWWDIGCGRKRCGQQCKHRTKSRNTVRWWNWWESGLRMQVFGFTCKRLNCHPCHYSTTRKSKLFLLIFKAKKNSYYCIYLTFFSGSHQISTNYTELISPAHSRSTTTFRQK